MAYKKRLPYQLVSLVSIELSKTVHCTDQSHSCMIYLTVDEYGTTLARTARLFFRFVPILLLNFFEG